MHRMEGHLIRSSTAAAHNGRVSAREPPLARLTSRDVDPRAAGILQKTRCEPDDRSWTRAKPAPAHSEAAPPLPPPSRAASSSHIQPIDLASRSIGGRRHGLPDPVPGGRANHRASSGGRAMEGGTTSGPPTASSSPTCSLPASSCLLPGRATANNNVASAPGGGPAAGGAQSKSSGSCTGSPPSSTGSSSIGENDSGPESSHR